MDNKVFQTRYQIAPANRFTAVARRLSLSDIKIIRIRIASSDSWQRLTRFEGQHYDAWDVRYAPKQ